MQNMQMNVVTFLETLAKRMRTDIDFAYPCNSYDNDRGHTALQMLLSKVESLEAFLGAIETVEEPALAFPTIGDQA